MSYKNILILPDYLLGINKLKTTYYQTLYFH